MIMQKIFQLFTATVVVFECAVSAATADPITVTSGTISLPRIFASGPMTLTGTDGVRSFTFDGTLHADEAGIDAFGCSPCLPDATEISVAIHAFSAIFGTVNYGDETYLTNGAFSDQKGSLPLVITGTGLLPPPPTAVGITATFLAPFTAEGRLIPPGLPPGGLSNSILGSGVVTVTMIGDPGHGTVPVWAFRSAEYRFEPTPEPASMLLVTTGLTALALRRRRYRRQ